MRVVADHLRAMTFLVSDGVLPGNEGRGYVLRKIMRRAMRHGKKLGIEGAFLSELTGDVVARMKAAYPELVPHAEAIARVVAVEEERFGTTLKQAFAIFEDIAASLPPGAAIPGAEVFRLYDTYGLPVDFTDELARDRGLGVDASGFERELAAQQERARQSSKMGAVKGDPVFMKLAEEGGKTDFLGYTRSPWRTPASSPS
jgi:alanyl-tRNA synthetase